MDFKLKKFNTDLSITRIANIHYFEFTGMYHSPFNSHKFNEMVYVDNGALSIRADNYKGMLLQNQLIIHRPNENHALFCREKTAPNVVVIGFECRNSELDMFSEKPVYLSPSLQKTLVEIIKEGRNVFVPPYDKPGTKDMKKNIKYPFGADQLIKNLLEYFLIKLIREYSVGAADADAFKQTLSPSLRVYEVKEYIDKNYGQRITLGELCFLFGTNKTTLCREFKMSFGTTVISYINRLKIKHAKILMREGKMNITQISETLNFSSIHYFTKLFKKQENISPAAYIKSIKSKLS